MKKAWDAEVNSKQVTRHSIHGFLNQTAMCLLEVLHEGASDKKIAWLLTLLQSIFSFILNNNKLQ
jgi:hypothetical protein